MAVDSPVKSEKVVTQEKEIMCVNGCQRLPVISHGAINKLVKMWEKCDHQHHKFLHHPESRLEIQFITTSIP